MKIENPFHQGEIEVQEMLGERSTALLNGRLYEDSVIGPAHKFLSQMFFFIMSTQNDTGEMDITVLLGGAGFMTVVENGKNLNFDLKRVQDRSTDPVIKNLVVGMKIGGLAIDLATRRRLRINGHVKSLSKDDLLIEVDESYPNCPKYIQKRTITQVDLPDNNHAMILDEGDELLAEHIDLISKTDTFFVASANPSGGLDASHRGGNPGFVKLIDNSTLRIPDYSGNSLYNTFGNFKLNNKAALVFWDFERALLLHLTGEARLDFSGIDPHEETGGTGRWWEFTPKKWTIRSVSKSFLLSSPEYSPFNPTEKV